MNASSVASATQRQWYSRPADEKFASLEDVYAATLSRKQRSHQVDRRMRNIHFQAAPNNDLVMSYREDAGDRNLGFTHWSFGQIGNLVGAHPEFLRQLPSNLASDVLNHCFSSKAAEKNRELGLMVVEPEDTNKRPVLQATTGSGYGRIWDSEIAQLAMELVDRTGGTFYSPLDWGGEKRALFSSDRDIHLLFIDGGSILDAGMTWDHKPDHLHRGWLIGNSEVGMKSMYLATFFFRVVCGNFAIHDISNVDFKRIIHTGAAPSKFINEAAPALRKYVDESPKAVEYAIKKAQELELPRKVEDHNAYFRHRGFTVNETQMARMTATREEGGCHTLWQMVNGFTKYAQRITHRDTRLILERKAGKLLELVAA
jgi:hypothetical protein